MANHLAHETSPYLRQHADNPVDWWPWCDEALAAARSHDKPVLLSIGYAACHWCHVMAHESFADDTIAARMNRDFVNIKVDREERPDLDRIYQLAHQIITQRPGGWPLTLVLDPHTQAPFMAGTYFPPVSTMGMPAFTDVLQQVADWYAGNSHQLADQKARLDEIFDRLAPAPGDIPDDAALDHTARELAANFDSEFGGFTGAPKFPHPASLALALQLGERGTGGMAPDAMAEFTLERMAVGGIFDHIGGGFFRYSVDARWEIPHFEKMLYDNGGLLSLYARTAGDGHPAFAQVANATADWALDEMRAPGGGFHGSLDADSEGGEGAFYVWGRDPVAPLLGDDFELFACAFGLSEQANFEGAWHLHRARTTADLSSMFGIDEATIDTRLEAARERLATARQVRVRPARDDKILTAWNALMIQGLATTARALGRHDCMDAAQEALDFIHAELWTGERLFAVHIDGHSHTPAFLDDYAFLLDALLSCLQMRWRTADLHWAQAIADTLLAHFEDAEAGGFHFTADDHESLLTRPKPLGDESTPAGNGIAAHALLHLGWLLGEPRYLTAAENTLAMAGDAMRRFPLAHASLLSALADYRAPPPLVVLRGGHETFDEWRQRARITDARAAVYPIPTDTGNLPPGLSNKPAEDGPVAYLCRGTTCSAPIRGPDALADALDCVRHGGS